MLQATESILHSTEEQIKACIDQASEPKSWKNVIITIPHAICPRRGTQGHPCDYAALNFAYKLRLRLGLEIIQSREERRRCDVNRATCPEPKILTDFLSRIRVNDGTLILDIHSFPPTESDFAPYEVVLLDPKEGFMSYSRDLVDFLAKRGIRAAVLQGGLMNNIIVSAIFLSSPCSQKVTSGGILFEINEGLSPQRASYVADVVTEWIVDHLDR